MMRNTIRRLSIVLLTLVMVITFLAPAAGAAAAETINVALDITYDVRFRVDDFGQNLSEIVLNLPVAVNDADLYEGQIDVIEKTRTYRSRKIIPRDIVIAETYVGDPDTLAPLPVGDHIILRVHRALDEQIKTTRLGKPLEFAFDFVLNTPLADIDGNFYSVMGGTRARMYDPIVDAFGYGEYDRLRYRDWDPLLSANRPIGDDETFPLIVWFHGTGEGGFDNEIQITANRGGAAFADPEVMLWGEAYVLAPQTGFNWIGNFYTDMVQELIESYVDSHPRIDRDRVYIGGCSSGGYQTWKTLLAKPDYYAAAFPICPAYKPCEKELATVVDKPIWITHAATDWLVPPRNSRTAYATLLELGATNVHYTEYDRVDKDGYNWNQHFSWVHTLANEPVLEDGTTIFEWLMTQTR